MKCFFSTLNLDFANDNQNKNAVSREKRTQITQKTQIFAKNILFIINNIQY